MSSNVKIHGLLVDDQSRCRHYQSTKDVIALRCGRCDRYYACFQCHNHYEVNHTFVPWPKAKIDQVCVICGVCRHEMTQDIYQGVIECPNCAALFNPGCSKHKHHYFEQ
ncbi:CHY zinc finger family protein [Nadsonia fulvescens var. elongata DSM 6958]|uniref:CHY zinc finger family protein n=1 Tax=Nadsonia fulvescens var. elongata DSM 6958 TaxID=857566 RepID=A0A1E3PPS7_9ASCO|nr:CHY zinc finger family protein [Nadsonia fulvescens var. elongata DSM 6958]